jgi:hypothetical protein
VVVKNMKANFLGHVGFCFVWLLATMNNVSSYFSSSFVVVVVVWFDELLC